MADEKLFTTAEVKQIGDEKLFIASDSVVDREGESIDVNGWDISDFKKNPVILWSHNGMEPSIGKATKIGYKTIDGVKRLVYQPEFHKQSELSKLVSWLVDNDWIKASSVGFLPKEDDGNGKYTKQQLLEVSFVNVPANPNALSLAMSKGFSQSIIKSAFGEVKSEKKGAVADELVEEQVESSKEEELEDVMEVCDALCDAYLDEEVAETEFNSLLAETIGILQMILAGNYPYEDETEEGGESEDMPVKSQIKKNKLNKKVNKIDIKTIYKKIDGIAEGIKYLTRPVANRSIDDADKNRNVRRRSLQSLHKQIESLLIQEK